MELIFGERGLQARIVKGGNTYVKPVALKDVAAKLSNGISVDFGLLPPNSRTISTVGPHHIVGVELGSGRYTLTVARDGKQTKISNVPLPAAFFVFVLTKTGKMFRQTKAYLFALGNDRIVLAKDKLYKFPVPNIYNNADNAENQICWGGDNELYDLPSLAGAESLVRTFFNAPFNHDLFGTDKLDPKFPWGKVSKPDRIDEFFKLLSEQPEFKTDWLAPTIPVYANYTTAINTITASLR